MILDSPDRPSLVPPGFPWRGFWLLLLLAAVLRLGTNLTRVDEHYQEGLVRGAVAEAWLEGAPVWPSQAPQIPHIRGSIIMSVISAPCFLLMGPTTFAVRVGGVLFHLVAVAALMFLMHRQFGRRAALFAGATFVLTSPSLARIAVLSYGDHIESLAFVFATAWVTLTWCEDKTGRRFGLAFATGVLAGLGIGFHAQARVGIAALGLACALCAPYKLLRRDAWLGLLPGLIVGFLPLAIGDWLTAHKGLLVWGAYPGELVREANVASPLAKWIGFWWGDLVWALQYPWLAVGAYLLLLSLACGVGLLLGALRRVRAGETTLQRVALRGGFFLAYPLVFSVAYANMPFQIVHLLDNAIQVRYVLPVVPVMLLPIAIAGARLVDLGRTALGAAVIVPPLLIGAWGSLSTWHLPSMLHEPARTAVVWESYMEHFLYGTLTDDEKQQLRQLELQLYDHPQQDQLTAAWVVEHADLDVLLDLIDRFDTLPEWTRPLRFNVPRPLAGVLKADAPVLLLTRYRELSERMRPFAGASAARMLAQEQPIRPPAVGALLKAGLSPEETRVLLRGFGQGLVGSGPPRFFQGRQVRAALSMMPEGLDLREVSFGAGTSVGVLVNEFFPQADHVVREYLEHVDPALRPAFARGLGAGYRWRFLELPSSDLDCPAVARLIALIGPELGAEFRAGLGGSDAAY